MLIALAWRNLWRQKLRTFLSVLSIAFASMLLVFMLSMQLGTYDTMKNNTLRIFDGFAQMQMPGYADDPELSNHIENPQELIAQISTVPGITAAAARGSGFAILANGDISYGAAIIGVDPRLETTVSTLSQTVSKGRYLKPGDTDAIVIGDALARNLGLDVGERITLLGSAADRSVAADSLRVVGLFHSGLTALDRQFTQMPLARFQETFALGNGASMVVISGHRLADVNRALPRLREIAKARGLVVRAWDDLQPALKQAITLDMSTAATIQISLVTVVAFIILNTLYMSVLERTREFGMLLAIGMKPGAIGGMMWAELVLMAGLGAALGILFGASVVLWFQGNGIPISGMENIMAQFGLPSRLFPTLSPVSALAGPLAILAAVTIGGIVPFVHIRRLEPVSAMGAA